jgi:hypothetical protein
MTGAGGPATDAGPITRERAGEAADGRAPRPTRARPLDEA